MNLLFSTLVLLIGGVFIFVSIGKAIGSLRYHGAKRWMTAVGGGLLAIGAAGFFGLAFSATGGLNWLPSSFEWPVGSAHGILVTRDGTHIVAHSPSGRIQMYDRNWKFLRGWPVDASGGAFFIQPAGTNQIEVITARRGMRLRYDFNGLLLSHETYASGYNSDFSGSGVSARVPTRWWLWTFTNPVYSWLVVALGMLLLFLADRGKQKRERPA